MIREKGILITVFESIVEWRGRKRLKITDDIKSADYKRIKLIAKNRKNWRCQWCQESANRSTPYDDAFQNVYFFLLRNMYNNLNISFKIEKLENKPYKEFVHDAIL